MRSQARQYPFAGRDRELAELVGAVEAAASGRGALFLIEGEPGIGKTRLARELAANAAERGARVLWGRCRENGGAPPYWPWVQALRPLVETLRPETLERVLGDGTPYVARAMPDVARRLRRPPPEDSSGSEHASFRFMDSVATFLRRVGNQRPLVLVLDDLHAADPPSLDLLEFVAAEFPRASLLVVGTAREAVPDRLRERYAEIARHAERLPLGGLDREAVGAILEQVTGGVPDASLIADVHRLTDGHPLFVRELTPLIAAGRVDGRGGRPGLGALPRGITETIEARLAPLSPTTLAVLEGAAVLGRRFEHATLAAMTGQPTENVLSLLEDARSAGVVEQEPDPRWYEFTHALVREVLYEAMPVHRRTALHRDAGETLERLFGRDAGGRVAEIAHHFLQAAAAGEAERAATYATRAGDWAAEHLAYADAVRHYENALGTLDLLGPNPVRRCELLIRLGDSKFRSGPSEAAGTAFREAIALARGIADGARLARAALGYAQPWDLAGGLPDESKIEALEEALQAVDPDDHSIRSELLARLAVELYFIDPIERADDISREAIDQAARQDDRRILVRALIARHFILWRPLGEANLDERLRLAERIQDLTRDLGDPELRLRGRVWYMQNLLEAGDLGGFDRELAAFSRVAEELRQPAYLWFPPMWRATRSQLRGDFDRAERHAREALEIGQRFQARAEVQQLAVQSFSVQQYVLSRDGGRLGDVEGVVKAAVEALPNLAGWRAGLALIHVETGHPEEARRELEHLAGDGFGAVREDGSWFTFMAMLAAVCADLGDVRRANAIYERVRPYAAAHVVVGWAGYLGSISHYLGRLAATMGRFDEAAGHFEDALATHRRMGAAPWVARTKHHYAGMLLRRGRPGDVDRARAMAIEALEAARSLGMEELAGRGEALLAGQEPGTEARAARQAEGRGVDFSGGEPRDGKVLPFARRGDVPESTPGVSRKRAPIEAVFRREGDYWTIGLGDENVRVRDAKGLRYVAELIRRPGREVHVLDLVAEVRGLDPTRVSPAEAAEAGLRGGRERLGEGPDAAARAAYRARIEELESEIEDAEARGHQEITANLRAEQELVAAELARGLGLGGLSASPQGERARIAVTKAIRATLGKIRHQSPGLARHLQRTVRTGRFCSYAPEDDELVSWRL